MNEGHVVKNAIIMAAGIGERLHPVTKTIPKPLVKVNGVRLIDSVVDGLRENGIHDIYVVVGYLKKQFDEWVRGQEGVKLIYNPFYDTCNNISSLYVAREYLENCMILDGDQYIYNSEILDPHFSLSGYNAIWCEGDTDEWLLDVEDGIIKSCSRTGGKRGWQLYSISRWTAEDGQKLKRDIEEIFESGNTQIYWDDVVMFLRFTEYRLGINKMKTGDLIEIDSLDELLAVDPSYQKYLDHLAVDS